MTQKKLYSKYQRDLKALQKKCLHRRSSWMDEYWAPAHSTGYKVKVCLKCGMTIDRKENPERGILFAETNITTP